MQGEISIGAYCWAGAHFCGYLISQWWWAHALTSWIYRMCLMNLSVESMYTYIEKSCFINLSDSSHRSMLTVKPIWNYCQQTWLIRWCSLYWAHFHENISDIYGRKQYFRPPWWHLTNFNSCATVIDPLEAGRAGVNVGYQSIIFTVVGGIYIFHCHKGSITSAQHTRPILQYHPTSSRT